MTEPSDEPVQSDDEPVQPSSEPAQPRDEPVQPTVVVGYPELSSAAARPDPTTARMERLPAQVRTLRNLLVACLFLLVMIVTGLGAALNGTLSRMDDLTVQVAALSAQVSAAPAAQVPVAPVPAQPSAPASPAAPAVAQLGGAPALAGTVVRPDGSDETGAILIGDPNAKDVVEVYVDYQCPYCQNWEAQIGSALAAKAMKPGSGLLLKQYTMAFLGETSPTLDPAGASARAGNAAACVLHSDGSEVFVPFSGSLFATADPSEPPGQFPVKELVALAKKAGASPEAVTCIEKGTYVPFVSATTQGAFGRGVTGTPTVVLNGRTLGDAVHDPQLVPLAATG